MGLDAQCCMDSGPRGPYEGTEQDSVDTREGRVAILQLSIQTWPLKEARRGSWIWLVLGGDLNRAAGLYGFAGAG